MLHPQLYFNTTCHSLEHVVLSENYIAINMFMSLDVYYFAPSGYYVFFIMKGNAQFNVTFV